VFGWETHAMEMEGFGTYTIFNLDGGGIGGMVEMGEQFPETVPAHWMTYFVVADADATVAKAQELGGSVAQPAFDATGVGRIAVLSDPNATTFAIIELPADAGAEAEAG
jgi:predicted enzyme related to lactoylglutathione lyase